MKTMLFALSTAATIAAASLIPATAGAMTLPARLAPSATAPTLVHDHCRPTWHCGYGGCGWRSSCGRHHGWHGWRDDDDGWRHRHHGYPRYGYGRGRDDRNGDDGWR